MEILPWYDEKHPDAGLFSFGQFGGYLKQISAPRQARRRPGDLMISFLHIAGDLVHSSTGDCENANGYLLCCGG